jgi:hypothetical protein
MKFFLGLSLALWLTILFVGGLGVLVIHDFFKNGRWRNNNGKQ